LWFQGHCGFEYYMEKSGARPVDFLLTTLVPGQIFILPSNNSNLIAPAQDDVELLETIEFNVCPWVTTVNAATGAGFYGAGGWLPFFWGSIPPEKYFVFRVVQPLQFSPPADMATAHDGLAINLDRSGRPAEAIANYQEALRLQPDDAQVLNNLAWLLATCSDKNIRDGQRGVQLAKRACELTEFEKTMFIGTLAAAYAEAGRFDQAIATAQRACDVAKKNGETALLQRNQELLERYRQHKPAHD